MRYLLAPLLIFTSVFTAIPALCDQFRITPSAGIRQEYNDNVFLDVRKKTNDYITTLIGGLELQKTTERTDLNLKGEVDPRFYMHNSGMNNIDQSYTGRSTYRLTPKLSISGSVDYIMDSRPDREVAVTGLVLGPAVRYRQKYGATAQYVLSEKNMVNLDLGYWRDHYGPSTLIGMEMETANLTMAHDLSEIMSSTKGRVSFGYSGYRFNNQANMEMRDFQGMIGASRGLSEVWSLSIDGGVRYTTSHFDQVSLMPIAPPFYFITKERQTNSSWGGVGQMILSYKGEKTNLDLSAGYLLLPASGSGTTSNRTFLTVAASRRLTYELTATLSTEYFLNKSISGQQSSSQQIDQDTLRVSPGIRYQINPDMFVEARHSLVRVFYNLSDQTATRNLFMVRFLYQHRVFE